MARTAAGYEGPTREEFLARLDRSQRGAFGEIERLLGNREDNLLWHYRIGRCLQRLCPRQEGELHFRHGQGWFNTLATLLSYHSSASLYKKLKFAEEYTPAEVKVFQEGGLKFTHIIHAFTESDLTKRRKLLERAVEEKWTSDQLKYQVRGSVEPSRSNQGRPPNSPSSGTYELELARLKLLTQKWLHCYATVFQGAKAKPGSLPVLKQLRQLSGQQRRSDTFRNLVASTRTELGELAKQARELCKTLQDLVPQ